jgi:protein phosphatase slingshot
MRRGRYCWWLIAVSAFAGTAVAVALGVGWLTGKQPNYSRIEPGLYLGGRVPAPPPGTRAVLNLCEKEDAYRAEIHRWEPIPDGEPAPRVDWLRQQVAFIDRQRRAGLAVYVHCKAGVSRGALVTVAYLMWRDGRSRDEALDFVRSRRPQVQPNPAFMVLLLKWERFLKDQRVRQKDTGPEHPT